MGHPAPTAYELFIAQLPPTDDEVAGMLVDLRRKLKGTRQVAQALGIHRNALDMWLRGARKPGKASARHVWLVWCLLCRPGEVTSVFHLSTCGRFTARADPATAGDSFKQSPKSPTPTAENTGDGDS